MSIIDTHCHIDVAAFDPDRQQVIENCRALDINDLIVPAIQASDWPSLISICTQYQGLHLTLGLHPVFIEQHTAEDIDKLDDLINLYQPVAIGEIGLDFYIKDTDKQEQIKYFEQQLSIAKDHRLPVVLHVRKAHDEVIRLLKKYKLDGGGTCHAFNGSLQQAKEYIKLNFKLGFGGTLTYDKASKIHKLAQEIPLDAIVMETDAPDMSGSRHKGQRNSPEYIIDAIDSLAKLKGIENSEVIRQTTENAKQIFAI